MQLPPALKSWIGLRKSIAIYHWKPFGIKRIRKFYSRFIQPGDLCFDLGAHVGNRTLAMSKLGARVVAVEPQAIFARYLRRRFARNSKVTILEAAIGASSGRATMFLSRVNPTISTLSGEPWQKQLRSDARYPISFKDTLQVRQVTIDSLIEEFGLPDFCKMDIENYEYQALLGLSQPIPLLSFEYYPPAINNALKCIDRLSTLGSYSFNFTFGETQKWAGNDWITGEEMKEKLLSFHSRYQYGDVFARLEKV